MDAPGLLESTALVNYYFQPSHDDGVVCLALETKRSLLNALKCNTKLPALCGYFLGTFASKMPYLLYCS